MKRGVEYRGSGYCFIEKTCKQCGKKIVYFGDRGLYAYKRKVNKNNVYFCSYSCMREFDRKKGNNEKK